jgi:predicted nucleic acid-binding protein
MSGTRFFLDTNAVIFFLRGNADIDATLANAEWIGLSSISVIEFLAFSNLSEHDYQLFQKLVQRIEVIGLTNNLTFLANLAELRKNTKLKLPDIIIAGQAIEMKAILISNDSQLRHVPNLSVINFEQS